MAEEKKYTYKPEDIERYRPIALAPEFVEKKDMGALEKTLLEFVSGLGVKVDHDVESEVTFITSKPDRLEDYIGLYTGKYQKALRSSTLKELRNLYSDLFEKFYDKENLPKVNKVFNSDETYGDFIKKYVRVVEIVQSKTDNFTDEQKKKAESDLKELNKIIFPLTEFEKLKIDYLRKPINEESLKKTLNDAYKEGLEKETKSKTESSTEEKYSSD